MDGPLVTLIIFGVLQVLGLLGVIWTNKTETKILSMRLDTLGQGVGKLEVIVTELVNQSNRLYLMEDRMLSLRKTVDEQTIRMNKYIDHLFIPPKV